MPAALQRLRHRAAHHAVMWLSVRPRLYYGVRSALRQTDRLCVSRSTELVIEGFPRSANSTTVHGFLARQQRPVTVAHHKHHAAQLLRAVEWRIPAVVMIRDPRGAILSLVALAEEGRRRTGRTGRGSALTFEDLAAAWHRFYAAVAPCRELLVVAPFDEVTRDLQGLIERVNERFATSFAAKPMQAAARESTLGWHALPNELRSTIKREVAAAFDDALDQRPRLRALMARNDELYATFARVR